MVDYAYTADYYHDGQWWADSHPQDLQAAEIMQTLLRMINSGRHRLLRGLLNILPLKPTALGQRPRCFGRIADWTCMPF